MRSKDPGEKIWMGWGMFWKESCWGMFWKGEGREEGLKWSPSYGNELKVEPGKGNGNPLQYSCLENPMDGGAWEAVVHGVVKSQIRLSDFTFTFQNLEGWYYIWIQTMGCG